MSLPRPIKTFDIIYRPPKIDRTDINPNGKLLTDAQIEIIKKLNLPESRTTKKELRKLHPGLANVKFSVVRKGDQYFAIYRGAKHGKSLGAGAFGVVKLAQNLETGTWAAMKVVKKGNAADLKHETTMLEKGKKLKTAYQRKNQAGKIQSEIIMELAGGVNLEELSKRKMPAAMWLDICIQAIRTVRNNLHKNGIIHCDLKPPNINYDIENNKVEPVDYGLTNLKAKEGNVKGSPFYMSQELFAAWQQGKDSYIYNKTEDVYSLGITLGQMLGFLGNDRFLDASTLAQDNEKIPDLAMRQGIYKILHQMTRTANKRYDLKTALKEFKEQRAKNVNLQALTLQVAYLNLQEYVSATPKEKTAMRAALINTDEICLLDTDQNHLQKHLEDVREDLKVHCRNCKINNKGLFYEKESLNETLKEHTKQRQIEGKLVVESRYLTKKGKLLPLSQRIDEVAFLTTQKVLLSEASRLFNVKRKDTSLQQELIHKLAQFIREQYENNDFNYLQLQQELEKLSSHPTTALMTKNVIDSLLVNLTPQEAVSESVPVKNFEDATQYQEEKKEILKLESQKKSLDEMQNDIIQISNDITSMTNYIVDSIQKRDSVNALAIIKSTLEEMNKMQEKAKVAKELASSIDKKAQSFRILKDKVKSQSSDSTLVSKSVNSANNYMESKFHLFIFPVLENKPTDLALLNKLLDKIPDILLDVKNSEGLHPIAVALKNELPESAINPLISHVCRDENAKNDLLNYFVKEKLFDRANVLIEEFQPAQLSPTLALEIAMQVKNFSKVESLLYKNLALEHPNDSIPLLNFLNENGKLFNENELSLNLSALKDVKGSLSDKRSHGLAVVNYLIAHAENSAQVHSIVKQLEDTKIDYLHKPQGTYSFSQQIWKGEKVSQTWSDLMKRAKNKVINLTKQQGVVNTQDSAFLKEKRKNWQPSFFSTTSEKEYNKIIEPQSPRKKS